MLNKLFRDRPAQQQQQDEQALLEALRQELGSVESLAAAFAGTSELPPGVAATGGWDHLLLRYLRAEKRNVDRAARRIKEQAAWRHGFGTVTEDDVAAELATGKVKLQAPTAASRGRPLLVVKARHHRPTSSPLAVQQFIFYCLEAASHYCWGRHSVDNKLVVLMDLSGLQVKNLDATALRACFAMLAQRFPERMSAVVMYDAPTIFWGLWKVVEPFVDSTARKNVRFVSGKAGRAELVEDLGAEIVPFEYGGTAAEMPVETAAQQLGSWRQKEEQWRQQRQGGELGNEGAGAVLSAAAAGAASQQMSGEGEAHVWQGMRLSHSSLTLNAAE